MSEKDWRDHTAPTTSSKNVSAQSEAIVPEATASGTVTQDQQPDMADTKLQGSANSIEETKEWRLIRTLLKDIQQEQVRRRRWGIVFKSLTFVFLFGVMFSIWDQSEVGVISEKEHVAVVDVSGVIMAGAPASAEQLLPSLKNAFEMPQAKAIILAINSPGGSPVQAGIIYDELNILKQQYPDKRIYAVISDVGASGAYYIAAAADYIYADKASMVGSIGVIANSFGFTDLINNIGIERRVYTAGSNKDFLDSFQNEKPRQREAMQALLAQIHQQFIDAVKQGRGTRLKDHQELFSGAIWDGATALELGLLDGLGSLQSIARDVIGNSNLQIYEASKTPLQELMDEMGAQTISRLQTWLGTPQFR